jgi:uncharacterized protein (TIGR00369 family)
VPTLPRDVIHQTFDACPFHRRLKMQLQLESPGTVEVRLPYDPENDQAMGMLHGGVYAALLDTASYYAALSVTEASAKLPLTQEYKINLLASARQVDLVARSTVVKAGKRSSVVETRIATAHGDLVAIGLTSLMNA